MPDKAETEGVVIIAPLEVQEAPSGTRTGLTSLRGALAILLVATQLVAFVQLPEAHQHQQREQDEQEQKRQQQQQLLGGR